MFIMDSPPPQTEIIAVLSTTTSRCEIRNHVNDDEAGNLIDVKCGSLNKPLGRAPKGISVNRINACRVVMTVNAVRSPRLLSLSNCHGSLTVTDVGAAWTKKLRQSNAIDENSVEFVAYKAIPKRSGCYDVIVTYDATPDTQNTSYREKTGRFCILR